MTYPGTCQHCGLRLHRTTSVDGIVGMIWYDPDGRAQCLARVDEDGGPFLPHQDTPRKVIPR